jgi:hypothetical protein
VEDTAEHILLQCITVREVWHICRHNFELESKTQQCRARRKSGGHTNTSKRGKARKDFNTLVCTISFALWNNRNAFVFGDERRDDITASQSHCPDY